MERLISLISVDVRLRPSDCMAAEETPFSDSCLMVPETFLSSNSDECTLVIAPANRSIMELKFSARRDISDSPIKLTRSVSSPSAALFIAPAICQMRTTNLRETRIQMTATMKMALNAYRAARKIRLDMSSHSVAKRPMRERIIPSARSVRIRFVPVFSFFMLHSSCNQELLSVW